MFKKCVSAALFVLGLSLATPAFADIISFDPDGGGALAPRNIASLDFLPGDAIALNVTANTPVGPPPFQLFFQANLGSSLSSTNTINYVNDTGAAGALDAFSVVVGFQEQIVNSTVVGGQGTTTFGFVPGGNNFFQIYAHTDSSDLLTGGNNTSGGGIANTCFVCGTLVMAGTIDPTVPGGQFVSNFTFNGGAPVNLDQFGGVNDYPGHTTLTGSGSVNLSATVSFANPAYFQGLAGSIISFAFANTSTKLPFQEADPSACFFATTVTGSLLAPTCGAGGGQTPFVGVGTTGAVNGLSGNNTIFQADANASFVTTPAAIPEPTTLTLLGVGLLGSAAARRRAKKAKK